MDKATLRQYRGLLREIDELEREKRLVLDRYLAPPQLTDMPIGSVEPDRIGSVVAQREKYQQMIDTKLDELISLRGDIEEAIASLPAADRRIIRARYVQGKSWQRIAREQHYSVDWLWHKHGEILLKMANNDR